MSLKNDIEREFHIPVRLRVGGPGAFDVFVNGEKVYSKKQTGRMPTSDEVIKLIHSKRPVGQLLATHEILAKFSAYVTDW